MGLHPTICLIHQVFTNDKNVIIYILKEAGSLVGRSDMNISSFCLNDGLELKRNPNLLIDMPYVPDHRQTHLPTIHSTRKWTGCHNPFPVLTWRLPNTGTSINLPSPRSKFLQNSVQLPTVEAIKHSIIISVNQYTEYTRRQGIKRGHSVPSFVTSSPAIKRSLVTVVESSWKLGEWSVAHEQLRVAIGHRTGNGFTFPGVRGGHDTGSKAPWFARLISSNKPN
jgi:hypothetical protein